MPDPTKLDMAFKKMVQTEDDALSLLRQHRVFLSRKLCPGKNGMNCRAIMKERKRKNRGDVWRFPRTRCRKELSLRAGCAFSSFLTNTVRHFTPLHLSETLEIMYMFVMAPTTLR